MALALVDLLLPLQQADGSFSLSAPLRAALEGWLASCAAVAARGGDAVVAALRMAEEALTAAGIPLPSDRAVADCVLATLLALAFLYGAAEAAVSTWSGFAQRSQGWVAKMLARGGEGGPSSTSSAAVGKAALQAVLGALAGPQAASRV